METLPHPGRVQYFRQLEGDFGGPDSPAMVEGSRDRFDSSWDRAWALANGASRALAHGETWTFNEDAPKAFADADAEARYAWLRALADGALGALGNLDRARLDALVAAASVVRCEVDEDHHHLWRSLIMGVGEVGCEGTSQDFATLVPLSQRLRDGPAVILATVLLSLSALDRGDSVAATAAARRAARMARTESFPQYEYVAGLALARVRRAVGRPYPASTILRSLSGFASAGWKPWVATELAWAGAPESSLEVLGGLPGRLGETPGASAARGLVALTMAVRSGDVEAYRQAEAESRRLEPRTPMFSKDLEVVLAALDPDRPVAELRPKRWRRWFLGEDAPTPDPLHGFVLLGATDDTTARAAACLVVGPGPVRRVLRVATPLVRSLGWGELVPSARPRQKQDLLLALLATAGPAGMTDGQLHRAMSGTAFDEPFDQNALEVLVHRARKDLPSFASITRRDGAFVLACEKPAHIDDPRCAQSIHDALLRIIGVRGGATTKELADELGVAMRTVQAAIRDLVDEGAFVVGKEGRQRRYEIIDTTFREPTLA
ncbi:MAG: winged helix-turn-helix domain-containing protein [Myxococcales bacterium]|nr:winged helix-turn-helix domain-containing protein [Myxococcales bacterium]